MNDVTSNPIFALLKAEHEFYDYQVDVRIKDFLLHGAEQEYGGVPIPENCLVDNILSYFTTLTSQRYLQRVQSCTNVQQYSNINLYFMQAKEIYDVQKPTASAAELWKFYDILEKWLASYTSQFTDFATHLPIGNKLCFMIKDALTDDGKTYRFAMSYDGLREFYRFLRAKLLTKYRSSYHEFSIQTILKDYSDEATAAGGCSLIADTVNGRYETLFVSSSVQYRVYDFNLGELFELATILHDCIAMPETRKIDEKHQRNIINRTLAAIVNYQIALDRE